eukprot:148584_1
MDVCVDFKDEFESICDIKSIIEALDEHILKFDSTKAWMQQMPSLLDEGHHWLAHNDHQPFPRLVSFFYSIEFEAQFIIYDIIGALDCTNINCTDTRCLFILSVVINVHILLI